MTATYYDGKTSRPYDAQVSVFGNTLTIDYQGIEQTHQEIWNISAIDYSSFTGKGKTMLKYGEFPHQHLEFPIDSPLHQTLENYLPKRRQGFWAFSNELANSGFRGVVVASVIFVAVAIGFYFWILPNIAEYVATKVPIQTEVKLGEELYKGMMKDYEIDKEKTKQLTDFAKKMDFSTNYPLKFTVIDDKMVNAFALPGGNVVVFNGILEKMEKPEELAALLSHEVSHVKERHSLKGMARDLAGTTVISVITGDASTIGSVLIEQADTFNGLKFSRNLEQDADLKGLEIMYLNKLDPQGMVELMESLQEEEDKVFGKDKEKDKKEGKKANNEKNTTDEILSYVSTHPLTKDRISYIKAKIKGKTGIKNEDLEKIWLELKKE